MSFIVDMGEGENPRYREVNTPCNDCDLSYEGGGAMRSGPELFKAGWHAHQDGKGGHTIFIDDSLYAAYANRYPGGPLQQLVEAAEAKPTPPTEQASKGDGESVSR